MLLLSSWLIHVPMTMRLCNSQISEEHLVCYQTSQHNWVIINLLTGVSDGVCWVGINWDYDLSLRLSERYLWAHSVIYITISLASIVTNELVAGWCITERVKRLAGNKIELGIRYRRSNLGQVTYRWQREQRMLLCGLTDKDLRRICRSQYEHPGSAIGYWLETCLGHV